MQISSITNGVSICWPDQTTSHYHSLWLRDNCGCEHCRVALSSERLQLTCELDSQPAITEATVGTNEVLNITWSDGHTSQYQATWLKEYDYSSVKGPPEQTFEPWGKGAELPQYDYQDLVQNNNLLLSYLDALSLYGAAIVSNTPNEPGTALDFAGYIGIAREVAFGKIHDVFNDPDGYNVAHTASALPPHTDLASYPYPPSGQLLHYLVNEAEGGETILVDGWHIAETIKQSYPEAYTLLSTTRIPFQIFSAKRDTQSCEPIIGLHPDGSYRIVRFSNQTALPFALPSSEIDAYYHAYQLYGRLTIDPAFQLIHKARAGDMLTVNNHRVMHGRKAYNPSSGKRHLQDVYVEWDDMMATARVIRGHEPMPACPIHK